MSAPATRRLVYLATDPLTPFRLMEGQLSDMRRRGFEVDVVCSPGAQLDRVAEREHVTVHAIAMTREISPLKDLVALAKLISLLRRIRPDLVNAGTPKAGLLGVIAARLAGVPVVVYLLRGLRMEGARGSRRLVLALTEHVAAGLAHRVFCNSESLREKLIALGCAARSKTFVPGRGTSNGVDCSKFAADAAARAFAEQERRRLGVSSTAVVVGFVGRLTRDKGVAELCQAFRVVSRKFPDTALVLIGGEDRSDPLPPDVAAWLRSGPGVHVTGFVDDPSRYYAMLDVLAFPSYREGFPNVPLEAAAASVPSVAFAATGTVDAIVDGVTGTLVPVGNERAFADALAAYIQSAELRSRHGQAARERVVALFERQVVWDALAAEYERLLSQRPTEPGSAAAQGQQSD